jgi:hypothetical protein
VAPSVLRGAIVDGPGSDRGGPRQCAPLLIVTGVAFRVEEWGRPLGYYLKHRIARAAIDAATPCRQGLGDCVARVVADFRWIRDDSMRALPTIIRRERCGPFLDISQMDLLRCLPTIIRRERCGPARMAQLVVSKEGADYEFVFTFSLASACPGPQLATIAASSFKSLGNRIVGH